jgi:hypothetical protein
MYILVTDVPTVAVHCVLLGVHGCMHGFGLLWCRALVPASMIASAGRDRGCTLLRNVASATFAESQGTCMRHGLALSGNHIWA